jgi:large subunit ribosomal protein L32e
LRKKFKRQEWWKYKRLGEKWRKPRGSDSRMRRRIKGRPPLVSVGYGSPTTTRGLHPSGFSEVLIHNLRELEGIDPKKQAVRIASGVGKRLRERILRKADERKLKVLNPG